MDPQWIERIYNNSDGEDFLGIRIISENILSYLLPGIITITQRARYYAFYCWLIVDYEKEHPPGWTLAKFIKRREQIFAFANFAFQPAIDYRKALIGLAGYNAVTVHWSQHKSTGAIPLTLDNFLTNEYGGYRIYSGVLQNLNAYQTTGANKIQVWAYGKKLADAFECSIQNTEYFKHRAEYDHVDSIAVSVLEEYGRQCHLSQLKSQPDANEVLELLFQFSSGKPLPGYESSNLPVQNMRGSLGMILDMCRGDLPGQLNEIAFLQNTLYAFCADYTLYCPSAELKPFIALWQIRTLRELYVYSLYGLWASFLEWLRQNGPQTLESYLSYLDQNVRFDLLDAKSEIGAKSNSLSSWRLSDYLNSFLNASHIPQGTLEERIIAYSSQSQSSLNEFELIRKLRAVDKTNTPEYISLTILLLTGVYIRLSAIQTNDSFQTWPFVELGGQRRRSLALFVEHFKQDCLHGRCILESITWLIRDYILTQHTIAALEKWRSRKANTFHFIYDAGYFEYVRGDNTGFAASRFDQAHNMLTDLGLISLDNDQHLLTPAGSDVLDKVLGNLREYWPNPSA